MNNFIDKINIKNNIKYKLTFEGIVFTLFLVFTIIELINQFNNHQIVYNMGILSIVFFVLSTFLVFYLELDYFKLYKQVKTFDFSMDLLIAFATHLTYLFSIVISIIKIVQYKNINHLNMEFWEVGYSLSFFIGLGHLIENNLRIKSSLGIKELLKLQNKTAFIKNNKNDFIECKSSEIKINDVVKILKGSSIPTDGILVSNIAYLDYSSLLGESIPRKVKKGQEILAGSIVNDQYIIYQCTRLMEDSALSKIIKQLEKILSNKSNVERISAKIVKVFLPVTIILSLATFVIWMVLTFNNLFIPVDLPWEKAYDNTSTIGKVQISLFHMISVLVIACPCAFGIATPAAIYSSSFIASKNKILFSSSKVYETLNNVKYLAFDKTGTLTEGKPKVINVWGKLTNKEMIYNIASNSTHPLSSSIKEYLDDFKNKNINFKDINEQSGIGVFAKLNKDEYFLGSLKYAINKKFDFKNINIDLNTIDKTTVVFAKNKKIINIFFIEDQIKKDAKEIINKFKNIDIKTIILSGDTTNNVNKIAKEIGIDYYYGDLLPIQKSEKIEEFKKQGKIVFVGDGINDILAIKNADVGMAFSSGSEITNSVADISLLENDLKLVYKTFFLSKRTILAIKINFLWAGLFNGICVPLSMIGFIPIWLGVILMTSSTIFLLLNTLLFKYFNSKKIKDI